MSTPKAKQRRVEVVSRRRNPDSTVDFTLACGHVLHVENPKGKTSVSSKTFWQEQKNCKECLPDRTMKSSLNAFTPRSLTPLIDELKERSHELGGGFFNENPLPAPTQLDAYFMGVADKHGIDMFDSDPDGDSE